MAIGGPFVLHLHLPVDNSAPGARAPVPPVTDVNAQNSSVADVEDSDMDGRTSGPPLLFEARDDGAALLRARASMSDENIEVWEGCGV